jgi:hypothetical protein
MVGALGTDAAAQQSRTEVITQAQAEKAKVLRPYEPTPAERAVSRVKRLLLEAPFYPYFGTVYSGGGLGVGAGLRRFYGDRSIWNANVLNSIRGYKLLEVSTISPGHSRGRMDVYARAGWRDATQVAFFGTGPDTFERDRANFRMKHAYATGGLRARPLSPIVIGAALSYEDYNMGAGRGLAPSIEQEYTPATAPGLGMNPTYLHVEGSAGIDWRPSAGYARRGGLYEVGYHHYADRDDRLSFDRVDAEIIQHVPLLRENWVLSFRGRVQTTLDDAETVPYFLLPALGGGSTLRGYESWRFRDRHSLLLSAEWRWTPSQLALDAAIFYDAGKVASRRSALDLNNLARNIGFGLRFHGPAATPLRIELAKGSEGPRLVFAGGAAF